MTFNQVNYFIAVAKYLNFTRAAASLFVTQSTLSRSIAAMETELGVKLVERDFHNVKLTPAGDLMYKETQEIMNSFNTLIHRVQAIGDAGGDRFSLGILEGQSVQTELLFAIQKLSETHPQLSIDIQRMYHGELLDGIKAKKLDAAQTIVEDGMKLDRELDCYPIKKLKCYLMAREDDSLWEEEFSLRSMDGKTLIAPADFHPGLEVLNKCMRQAGVKPKIKMAPDMETQALWLEAGLGVYIANENNIVYTSRTFRPVKAGILEELPSLSEVLIWNKSNKSPLVDMFLSFIKTGHSG